MLQQENLVSSMVSMSNDFSERKAPADDDVCINRDDDEGHFENHHPHINVISQSLPP